MHSSGERVLHIRIPPMDQTDAGCRAVQPEYLLTACGYRLNNRGYRNSYRENQRNPPRSTGGFLREKGASMSLSSARNYALRARRTRRKPLSCCRRQSSNLRPRSRTPIQRSSGSTNPSADGRSPSLSNSSLPGRAMAPGAGGASADFRFGKFALWACEHVFLRAIGAGFPA